MTDKVARKLISMAWAARENSYAPYSNFMVGAALLAEDGRVFTGCNIENAAYSPSNCAERTAVFQAVAQGVQTFTAIAIVGEHAQRPADPEEFTPPCGVCRQVLLEFCNPATFQIVLGNRRGEHIIYTLEEMLPHSFKTF